MQNKMVFTKDQDNAISLIRDWYKSNDEIFVLSGYAGTGKTTLIKKFLDETKAKIAVSAPTHKAKKVISKIIDRNAVTLHSLLGLRMGVELSKFDPHNPVFRQIRTKSTFSNYDLVVIDEASMINKELLKLIMETIHTTKVIFMGDPAQLPPVNEDSSPVFELNNENYFLLTNIIRQENDNPLLEIFTNVRKIISGEKKTRTFEEITVLNRNNEGIEYISSIKEWRKIILEYFNSDNYIANPDYAKVITYTNDRVEHYNKFIRSHLFSNNSNQIEMDEIFMSYNSIYDGTIPILDNSADYIVTDISEEMLNSDENVGYFVKLQETNSKLRARTVFVLKNDINNLRKAAEESMMLLQEAKSSVGWSRKTNFEMFFNYKDRNLTQDNIFIAGKLCLSASLKNGYAITCHKAQGSTYCNVFIDAKDMQRNHNVFEKWRLLYVAMTRPSKKAFIYTKPKNQGELFNG